MFAVKKEVLDDLMSDVEWRTRLEKAKTRGDVVKVLAEFCRARGYVMVDLGKT